MSRYVLRLLVIVQLACYLHGCGGGSGNNPVPFANAGVSQRVDTGTTVTLDGTASKDLDGDSLAYTWTFVSRPAGSTATMANPSAAKPTFMADVSGTYVIALVVTDGKASSTVSLVTVNAGIWTVTVIDEPHSVHQGDVVTLPVGNHALLEVTRVRSLNPRFTYTEGVDYSVDFARAEVTILRGGRIDRTTTGTDLLISYKRDNPEGTPI